MSSITGWGRSTWGSGAWGEAIPVEPTGLAITSAVGAVTVDQNSVATVTGLGMSASVGAAESKVSIDALPSGLSMTASVGSMFLYFPIDTGQTPNYTPIER